MSSKKQRVWGTMAVLVFLLWTTGSAAARPPADQPTSQEEIGVAAVVTPLLQYQGRLTDPGTGDPVPDGVYEISFRLYNVESGGTPLWTETGDVSVQAGLFSTVLGDTTALNLALFNGQALWLGIKVGTDAEATPRQPVLPVAYALSLVPGAMVQANSAPVLQVNHTGGGEALRVGGNLNVSGSLVGGSHNHSGENITTGTVADARVAASLARDAEVASAVSGHSGVPDAHHARYTDTEAWSAVTNRDGPNSGLNADLLDGYQGSELFALNESETITGRPAFNGGTSGSTPPFTVDSTYLVTYLNADYLDGYSSSAFASSSHSHDDRYYQKRTGTQFTGTLDAGQTKTWFTFSWPADEIVYWSVHPTTSQGRVNWSVDIKRDPNDTFVYYITIKNTGSSTTSFEAKYIRFR